MDGQAPSTAAISSSTSRRPRRGSSSSAPSSSRRTCRRSRRSPTGAPTSSTRARASRRASASRTRVDVVAGWPDDAFEKLGAIDPATYIAVLTHDPKLDDAVLLMALRSDAQVHRRDGLQARAEGAPRAPHGARRDRRGARADQRAGRASTSARRARARRRCRSWPSASRCATGATAAGCARRARTASASTPRRGEGVGRSRSAAASRGARPASPPANAACPGAPEQADQQVVLLEDLVQDAGALEHGLTLGEQRLGLLEHRLALLRLGRGVAEAGRRDPERRDPPEDVAARPRRGRAAAGSSQPASIIAGASCALSFLFRIRLPFNAGVRGPPPSTRMGTLNVAPIPPPTTNPAATAARFRPASRAETILRFSGARCRSWAGPSARCTVPVASLGDGRRRHRNVAHARVSTRARVYSGRAARRHASGQSTSPPGRPRSRRRASAGTFREGSSASNFSFASPKHLADVDLRGVDGAELLHDLEAGPTRRSGRRGHRPAPRSRSRARHTTRACRAPAQWDPASPIGLKTRGLHPLFPGLDTAASPTCSLVPRRRARAQGDLRT